MEPTGDKYPRTSFNEVDEHGKPIERLDLTESPPNGYEKKNNKPAIEFGAVTSMSSTILAHNQPEKKKTATTTTPDTMKAASWKLTLTPNSNSHLTSSQQTNKSGESSDTISPSPAQPPSSSSKLKRLGPFTNESKDKDEDGYIDIDAPPPKKPRLFPSPQTTTAPTTTPSNPIRHPVITGLTLASLQRSLAAATQQLKHEHARRRKAERRAAEYARHGAPVMRTAARLARWVVDMYAEHQQQQGGRREDEIEAFLREIRHDVGPKAWGRLLWLGKFLRDNLDEEEGGGGGRGGGGAKNGAVKLEKEVVKKEAARRDGISGGDDEVADIGKSGDAVAKGTMKLEDGASMS